MEMRARLETQGGIQFPNFEFILVDLLPCWRMSMIFPGLSTLCGPWGCTEPQKAQSSSSARGYSPVV